MVAGYCLALGAGILFAFLVAAAGEWNEGQAWEHLVLERVARMRFQGLADRVMEAVPWLGTNWTSLPLAVTLGVWFSWRKRYDLAMPILVIQFGSNTLNAIVKHVAWRERPALWEQRGIFAWPSYPSGHAIATVSVLLFLAILLVRERGSRWAIVLALPIGLLVLYSRLYLGVHWPTDVVGGVLIGGIWLATIVRAFPARAPTDVETPTGA